MKSQIIEQLGQADILLPSLVAEGLAANDRIKVRAHFRLHLTMRSSPIVRPPICMSNVTPPELRLRPWRC
jgi:hypothetical protein